MRQSPDSLQSDRKREGIVVVGGEKKKPRGRMSSIPVYHIKNHVISHRGRVENETGKVVSQLKFCTSVVFNCWC